MQTRWVPVLQADNRRVQAWLGPHLIADWIGDAPHAARLEGSMRSQFRSLRITNEPLGGPDQAGVGRAGRSSQRLPR